MNEKFVLACLHTSTGHFHFYSYLNIVGLPSITNQKFKGIERKVGKEIEQVEEESFEKWKEAEIVINSCNTGLGLFLQISFAHWFYLRYCLISLLPDTTPRMLIDISEFQIHEKRFITTYYRLSFQLFTNSPSRWTNLAVLQTMLRLLLDGNWKLPSTLLPLYGNNKVMKM